MKLENLRALSFIFSIIGIIFLSLASLFVQPRTIDICSLNTIKENEYVKIYGTITKQEKKENFILLTIKNSSCYVKALCNCKKIPDIKNVEAIGKTKTYSKNGKKEIEINIYKIKQR